jgi:uncharacterized membrane protein HdeD (DUF308 family)
MTPMAKELRRLSHTLIARGSLMCLLGLAAAVWPEPILIAAMIAVGVVASVLGLYEMSIGLSLRHRTPEWSMILVHGTASLAFGLLTVGAPGLTLDVAIVVIAAWFLVYAGICWKAAVQWRSISSLRWTLVVWGCVDAALSFLAVVYPATTIFVLLFFGAVYAALFGAWQIAMGVWIRRLIQRDASIRYGAPTSSLA